VCGSGFYPVVSSDNLHYGEEPPISGYRGSGTIFLTGCNLRCVFCQNYPISQLGHGNQTDLPGLALKILRLQETGAHNINFVTPTHFAPQIMGALLIAYRKGLKIPVVYNCGGYESFEMIKLWEGIIDIYMPDMKYSHPEMSKKYSSAIDYPEINHKIIKEMARQTGNLKINEEGIAYKGLLIRHLVLPEDISGTHNILRFISEEISTKTYISLMSQYFPAHKASTFTSLKRRINGTEYKKAKDSMNYFGLHRGWMQEM
jgi:putative pyruvate formate lyase activating enzyme